MSEIRVCVRGLDGDHWADLHGSDGDRLIAACSHTPRSLGELLKAAERYEKGMAEWVEYFHSGCNFKRHDAGLLIIDLTARLIVLDSGYSDPQLVGQVAYHNGNFKTSERIGYDLTAYDWLITKQVKGWESLACRRYHHLQGITRAHPLDQSARTFGAERQSSPAPLVGE